MPTCLIISNSNELTRVQPDRIVYISSDGNYSTMVLADKQERLFGLNLSSFQAIIEQQLKSEASDFIRIGKCLIINRNYIHYINPSKQKLILSGDAASNAFMLSASKEALKELKRIIESTINH